MKITESHYTIEFSHAEITALLKGLSTLDLLQKKYPDERTGFDLASQTTVQRIHLEIENVIQLK